MKEPPELKTCRECKLELPVNRFMRNYKSSDGLVHTCQQCRRQGYVRVGYHPKTEVEQVTVLSKICFSCGLDLPVSCFYKASARKDGVRSSCKSCLKEKLDRLKERDGIPVKSKICNTCGNDKLPGRFGLNRNNPDKLTSDCRECLSNRKKKGYSNMEYRALRARVVEAYGGKCACCIETNKYFLSVDHINGVIDAGSPRAGDGLYRWLERNAYPKDNYQILCFNCNLCKGFHGKWAHDHKSRGDEWMESW